MKIHKKCEVCGHTNKTTRKDKLKVYLNTILNGFGIAFIVLYSLGFILFNTVYITPNTFSSLLGVYLNEYSINNNELELKEIAVDITNGCKMDEYCYAYNIYKYLEPFNYSKAGYDQTRIYDEMFTLKIKSGDCKSLALLYSSLLHQVGGNVQLVCSSTDEIGHCWNEVYIKETNTTYLVDVANDIFLKYNEPIDKLWWN